MIIAIQGEPGSGKTTICKHLIELLRKTPELKINGFITQEVRDKNQVRIGFEVITVDGARARLASVDMRSPYRVGKYYVDLDSFEKIVRPLFQEIKRGSYDVFIIDEIGKMELFSKFFEESMYELIQENQHILVCTLPIKAFHPLIRLILEKAEDRIFTERDRKDSLKKAEQILSLIQKGKS